MCPVPSSVHREPICCECQAKFGGRLPVRRAEAVLPYWVPLSLRPRKQIQKMVWFYVPQTTKACPCPCHHFGGRLPMPRDEAVMPYWVPQVLRSHKKVRGRLAWQRGLKVRGGLRREPEMRERVLGSFPTVVSVDVWGPSGSRGLGQQNAGEVPLDVRSGYNRWRICDGEGRRLLKWQQLQALHQAVPVSLGQPASLPASLLPLSLSLLIVFQALLSVIVALRVAASLYTSTAKDESSHLCASSPALGIVNKTWFSSVSLPQEGSGPHVQFIKCLMSGLGGPGPPNPEALSAS
ncbi:uncharacterized protein C16orf95 homolog [Delphinapterus leucas]|uniref:Uncharacterized protein C16orf95 homolog n=1 Tax=Delphinapterus leucas TaxID=9749 RepID=A0A7F8K7R6_DELLE|nr:uncharacterized protein C16orf95 homolog [Delphinapterus leucas]